MPTILPRALGIFADVVQRSLLPEEEIDAARQVMFQELMAIEDDPAQRVLLELKRRRYGSPWGHACIGDRAGIEAVTVDRVRQFINTYYRPAGAILGVAGRFDWSELTDQIESSFGQWEPRVASPIHPSFQAASTSHTSTTIRNKRRSVSRTQVSATAMKIISRPLERSAH